MSVNKDNNSIYQQGVSMSQVNSAIQEATSELATGYIPKGPASVATLNGLTGQENGWLYTMTDDGTLTDGSLAVVAGDSVAWNDTDGVWYKAMNYAPAQYGTDQVKNLPTSITAFRTGDVIPVDGPSGTAKMNKDDLLKETAEKPLAELSLDDAIRELALQNGFSDALHLKWESGSINYPSGTDHVDDPVIRTPLPRFQFKDKLKFIVLNDKYRIRYYTFNGETGDATSRSNWYSSVGRYDIDIDTTKYYRVQIATNTASVMDAAEALKSILIVYNFAALDFLGSQDWKLFSDSQTWESGSINTANGNNAVDSTSVRYSGKQYLDGDVKVVFLKTTYRVRLFYYNQDGSFAGSSGWILPTSGIRENPTNVNKKYLYRIQISTYNVVGDIDMTDALSSVKIYRSNYGISFWRSYIDGRIQDINSLLTDGKNKSVFLFLTDTHWNESPVYLNHYGINAELMRYVASKCNIGFLIHGGDLNSEYRSNKNIARQMMTEPVAIMRSAFENVLLTRGNHDDNIEGSGNNWNYVITQSDSYSYMFRGTKDVHFGETGTYFYKDIPFEKLRIISLDCVDFPYENTIDPTKSDLKVLAYGYTQLQWLCDVLKNTPQDYHIVLYTHAMLAPSVVTIDHPNDSPQTRAKDYLVLCEILKAYKNRSNFTYPMDGTYVSVHQDYYTGLLAGDFTSSDASIVAVFSGHEHVDCIEEILDSNGDGIGIYNTCTQNSSNLFADSVLSHTYQHPMQIGTISELVWDVVVIDRANKHVAMLRIGASEANTDIPAVDVREFDYE